MRRSTLIGMAIVAVVLVAMTWLLDKYVDQVRPELETARELTKEFAKALAPETNVKVRRVVDDPKGFVEGGKQVGLRVEATPSETVWKADATGGAIAQRIAQAASKRYGADRPIQWLLLTLVGRPAGGDVVFGFRVGDDRDAIQVSRTERPPPR